MGNWDVLLPEAQLAINNSWQESVRNTPFWLNNGRHPYIPGITTFKRAGLVDVEERNTAKASWNIERVGAVQTAKRNLVAAQQRMKRQFDKGRQPKEFQVGQRVLLNARNLKRKDLKCAKFGPRFVGPFTIEEKVGTVSYKLTLPDTMQVHPVFHVELLREYRGNEFTFPPSITCDDGTEKDEVEMVLRARYKGNRRQYLLKWKGLSREFASWEPAAQVRLEIPEMISNFDSTTAS